MSKQNSGESYDPQAAGTKDVEELIRRVSNPRDFTPVEIDEVRRRLKEILRSHTDSNREMINDAFKEVVRELKPDTWDQLTSCALRDMKWYTKGRSPWGKFKEGIRVINSLIHAKNKGIAKKALAFVNWLKKFRSAQDKKKGREEPEYVTESAEKEADPVANEERKEGPEEKPSMKSTEGVRFRNESTNKKEETSSTHQKKQMEAMEQDLWSSAAKKKNEVVGSSSVEFMVPAAGGTTGLSLNLFCASSDVASDTGPSINLFCASASGPSLRNSNVSSTEVSVNVLTASATGASVKAFNLTATGASMNALNASGTGASLNVINASGTGASLDAFKVSGTGASLKAFNASGTGAWSDAFKVSGTGASLKAFNASGTDASSDAFKVSGTGASSKAFTVSTPGASGEKLTASTSQSFDHEVYQLTAELLKEAGLTECLQDLPKMQENGFPLEELEDLEEVELCAFCRKRGLPCCMTCLQKQINGSRQTVNHYGNVHGFKP